MGPVAATFSVALRFPIFTGSMGASVPRARDSGGSGRRRIPVTRIRPSTEI